MLEAAAILMLGLGLQPNGGQLTLPPEVHAAIVSGFSAGAYSIQSLAIPPVMAGEFAVPVDLGGIPCVLHLQPHSIRAGDFRVMIVDGTGALVEYPPPPPRTFRGQVQGIEGSIVGSLLESGLHAIVATEAGCWVIQPLNLLAPVDRSLHVVMPAEDLLPTDGWCPGGLSTGSIGRALRSTGVPRGQFLVADVQAHADFALFGRTGSDVDDTVADVEMVMHAVSVIYERDVSVSLNLGGVLVSTSQGEDPYTSNDAGTLLDQFRTWWNANQGSVVRDLAHLFTGRELDGSTIGLAYLGVVCTSPNYSYGLSETRYSLNLNNRIALTAHEIGHNFSATHCAGEDCHIMCPTLNGCGGVGLPNFGPSAINEISDFAQSGDCYDVGDRQPLPLPVVDTFPVNSYDATRWGVIDNALITNSAVGEPSPPWVALLHQTSGLETWPIDLVGPFDRPVTVSFWLNTYGVDAGETISVLYRPDGGALQSLISIASATSNSQDFPLVRLRLPPGALGRQSSIALVSNGNGFDDGWYLDDFRVEVADLPSLPIIDAFSGTVIDQLIWEQRSGAVINQGSPTPPSAPYVLNLDNADFIETMALRADTASNQDVWIEFAVQSSGVESSEPLEVLYRNAGGALQMLWSHEAPTTERSLFRTVRIPLPQAAESDALSIRWRATSNESADDWFVDDVRIERAEVFAPPFFDEFDDVEEVFDPTLWFPLDGGVINQGALGNPSGTSVLNLDWADTLTTRPFHAGVDAQSQVLVARMWVQSNGVESGKRLYLDYLNASGAWVNAWSVRSNTTTRTTFGRVEIALPAAARHAQARLRLRVDGADGSDDWFVDDLSVDIEPAPSPPVIDTFPSTVISGLIWGEADSVTINSGAINPPSPPYVLNLDFAEHATTQPINMSSASGDSPVVTFYLQHNGVEAGKHLYVDYSDAGGTWRRAATFTSTSDLRTTYGAVNMLLGQNALHAAMRVRLMVDGVDGGDDWFIDDFRVRLMDELDGPVFERFLSTRLDPWLWQPLAGSPVINSGAVNPPSAPYVLNLDRDESLQTPPFGDSTFVGDRPSVSFFLQHNGVEPGKSLMVDLVDPGGTPHNLRTFISDTLSRTPFAWYTLDLPAETNSGSRVRLSVLSPDADDDWFLDDIFIGEKTELFTPWSDDFESALELGLRNWPGSSAGASTGATGEPSGAASMRIGLADYAQSLPMRLENAAAPQHLHAWVQHAGGTADDQLAVYYIDQTGAQRPLATILTSQAGSTSFRPWQVELPFDALHAAFRVIFAWDRGNGVWFLDDVGVTPDVLDLGCPPDLNADGSVDFFDLQLYLNAFSAELPEADLNADGSVDFFDVQLYLNLFSDGCE
ncbi:MAG: hypothetical protein DYG94_04095 [Leptolyngbya sp. PLA3]|nr:MAG: hypothetical protein EDM82_07805 [Cyanobacteria bacterium CYA]MCE7967912.1 hypothetical protein [Leptolyngbya sp. PL-A3]